MIEPKKFPIDFDKIVRPSELTKEEMVYMTLAEVWMDAVLDEIERSKKE